MFSRPECLAQAQLSRPASPAAFGRALSLCGTTVLLGLAFHELAGGVVTPGALILAVIPTMVASAAVVRLGELSLPVCLALLALGQVWVHLVSSSCGYGAAMSPGPSMLSGHALAVALAALWLRRREATAWAEVRWSTTRSKLRAVLNCLRVDVPILGTQLLGTRPGEFVLAVPDQVCLALPSRRGPPRLI